MPYTNQEFLDAIVAGQVDTARRIINDKDPDGVPYADLNRATLNQPTTLLYATEQSHSVAICKLILGARNNNQEPIINLNKTDTSGATALTNILYSKIYSAAEKIELTNLIVNLRNPSGSLVFNFDGDGMTRSFFVTVLDRFYINEERRDLLTILLDARQEDGSFAISLSQCINYYQYVISYFKKDPYIAKLFADAIKARTAINLDQPLLPREFVQLPELKPNVALSKTASHVPQKVVPSPLSDKLNKQIAANFNKNKQNTHVDEVEESVTNSILALEKYYPNVNIEKNIREIQEYIASQPHQRAHLKAFYRITAHSSKMFF